MANSQKNQENLNSEKEIKKEETLFEGKCAH